MRHLEWFLETMEESRPPLKNNGGLLSNIFSTLITVNPPTIVDGSGGGRQWGVSMVVGGGWCQLMAPVGGGCGL